MDTMPTLAVRSVKLDKVRRMRTTRGTMHPVAKIATEVCTFQLIAPSSESVTTKTVI